MALVSTLAVLNSYVMEGWLKTEDLVHDEALLSVTLLDKHRKPLEQFDSEVVARTRDWVKLRVGPFAPLVGRCALRRRGPPRAAGQRSRFGGQGTLRRRLVGVSAPSHARYGQIAPAWVAPNDDVEVICRVSGVLSP